MICTKSFDVLNFTNFKVSIPNVIKVLLETFKSKTCTSNHVSRAQFNFVYWFRKTDRIALQPSTCTKYTRGLQIISSSRCMILQKKLTSCSQTFVMNLRSYR